MVQGEEEEEAEHLEEEEEGAEHLAVQEEEEEGVEHLVVQEEEVELQVLREEEAGHLVPLRTSWAAA